MSLAVYTAYGWDEAETNWVSGPCSSIEKAMDLLEARRDEVSKRFPGAEESEWLSIEASRLDSDTASQTVFKVKGSNILVPLGTTD